MSKITYSAQDRVRSTPGNGRLDRASQFDTFPQRPTGVGHGAQFDEFAARASNPHGPMSDEGYRGDEGGDAAEVDRQVTAIANHIRALPAHHKRLLCQKLGWSQAAQVVSGVDKRLDEWLDVQKQDREVFGIEPDDGSLAAALRAEAPQGWVEQVNKRYQGTEVDVAKTRRR